MMPLKFFKYIYNTQILMQLLNILQWIKEFYTLVFNQTSKKYIYSEL